MTNQRPLPFNNLPHTPASQSLKDLAQNIPRNAFQMNRTRQSILNQRLSAFISGKSAFSAALDADLDGRRVLCAPTFRNTNRLLLRQQRGPGMPRLSP